MNKTGGILLGIGLSVATYFAGQSIFSAAHAQLIAIIVLLVTLWTNEALPLGVVSLLPILLFPAFGLQTTQQVASNYSNSIIFLFLGGFMLAIAVQKIGLHKVIAHRILKLMPATPTGMIYSLCISSALLSAFLSNTTTAILLISIALFLSDEPRLQTRLVIAVAYGASIGGIVTPIGTPPNLILLGFMESMSLPSVGFIQWMGMTVPLAAMMLLLAGFILSRGTQDCTVTEHNLPTTLTAQQKQLAWILLGMVLLLLINSPIKPYYDGLGLSEKGILLGFGLLMFAPGLNYLNWQDTQKLPYEIIFLFGAGFSIAAAFIDTGFASEIARLLSAFTQLDRFYLILLVAAFVTFSTEITSNTALVSMILPVIYQMSQDAGLPHGLFLMVATICASYAFMLPIATPPNAIALGSGVVHTKDLLKRGLLFNLLGILLISSYAMLFWSGMYE
ncbi:MAG: DASS family sodium-coupled anion symporter [Chromatiales bacterium]|jgi:sodium-dependent dicarboxylate transporter 2/3/5